MRDARQSRAASLAESLANVAVGFGVACTANALVLPWFGLAPSLADTLGIGAVMTAVSIARSYVLRRLFEEFRVRSAAGSEAEELPYGDVPRVPPQSVMGKRCGDAKFDNLVNYRGFDDQGRCLDAPRVR